MRKSRFSKEQIIRILQQIDCNNGRADYMLGRTYLYPFMRFATPDPARDGWSLYAYTGNNPVNYVDPDGHVLVSAAIDTLREIAGDAADKVAYTEWGTIDVSGFTQEDLANNEGALLIHQLATSSNVYLYIEGPQIHTRAGWRDLRDGFKIENLDTNYDWRYLGGKSDAYVPPNGVADVVGIDSSIKRVDAATSLRVVSRGAQAFHELAEAYAKVDRGLQYNFFNGGSGHGPGGAHEYAISREIQLLRQRPIFTDFPAGGGNLLEIRD